MAPKRASSPGEKAEKKKKARSEPTAPPPRDASGKAYYLLKKQIDKLSAADIEKAPDQTASMTGIHSHPSKKVLETMQEGDEVLFYRTSPAHAKAKDKIEPGVTALCTVVKAPYPDPEDEDGKGWLAVDVKLEEVYDKPILLKDLKQFKDSKLKGFTLFSNNLLAVHHVSEPHFNFILSEELEVAADKAAAGGGHGGEAGGSE